MRFCGEFIGSALGNHTCERMKEIGWSREKLEARELGLNTLTLTNIGRELPPEFGGWEV